MQVAALARLRQMGEMVGLIAEVACFGVGRAMSGRSVEDSRPPTHSKAREDWGEPCSSLMVLEVQTMSQAGDQHDGLHAWSSGMAAAAWRATSTHPAYYADVHARSPASAPARNGAHANGCQGERATDQPAPPKPANKEGSATAPNDAAERQASSEAAPSPQQHVVNMYFYMGGVGPKSGARADAVQLC